MSPIRFEAHQVALTAARLSLPLASTEGPSAIRALCGQLVRAVTSVPLNLAEGNGRLGRDRRYHFSVAYASAKEATTALQLLAGTDFVDHRRVEAILAYLDRVQAMTWRLMKAE